MKLKGKQFDTILDIQKDLIEAISIISKEDFQRSFLKLYRRKHCISSEEMYFK